MARKNSKKAIASIDVSNLANSAETLLANIRFAGVDEPVKVVSITSAGPDEGKSTSLYALALAAAKTGARTLLIDCDMRRRSLGKILGVHSRVGFYGALSGNVPLKSAIIRTNTPNLYFLDSEPNVSSPADLLGTKRFGSMLNALSKTFDYVFIDTPPVGLFIDAAVVAKQCDGVILAVRERYAKKAEVSSAIEQLRTANARILGMLMTFVQHSKDDYYYYYYEEEHTAPAPEKKRRSSRSATPKDGVAFAPGSFKK